MESRDGSIWLGSGRGLIHFIDRKFSCPTFYTEQAGVFNILEDTQGNLWFLSRSGLYLYPGNHLINISKRFNLANDILALFQDSKGNIWIGAESGLRCIDKDKMTHYSTHNSALLDNICYCILEDEQEHLWIGHSKGISCFDGVKFIPYTSERLGLTGRTWFRGLIDNCGHLWFGTTDGVTTFAPPPVSSNSIPPPVHITGVKVMEKEISLLASIPFDYNENIFRFNFTGISFNNPGGIQYKYRMDNIDNDWQTTTDRSLFYPFLPPGTYTFKVKAINSDGVESVKPAEYSFIIRPPFWKTWWFLVLSGLLLNMFLLLVIQWRIRRAKEKAELKSRGIELEARNRQLVISQRMELMGILAAGTVHDLKNLLSVIIGYSRLMAQNSGKKKTMRISKLSKIPLPLLCKWPNKFSPLPAIKLLPMKPLTWALNLLKSSIPSKLLNLKIFTSKDNFHRNPFYFLLIRPDFNK
jgi:hypothetical protein